MPPTTKIRSPVALRLFSRGDSVDHAMKSDHDAAAHSHTATMLNAGCLPNVSLTTPPPESRHRYRQVFRTVAPASIRRPGVCGSTRCPSANSSTPPASQQSFLPFPTPGRLAKSENTGTNSGTRGVEPVELGRTRSRLPMCSFCVVLFCFRGLAAES